MRYRLRPLLIVLAAGLSAAGCSQSVTQVTFIVPAGFRGALVVREKPGLRNESASRDTLVLKASDRGEAFVADLAPFSRWFEIKAQFDNGIAIPLGESLESEDRQVAIWALHTDEQGSLWHYIGTKEEAVRAAAQDFLKPGEQVPPNPDGTLVIPH
jgi:hypothetical protein